MGTKAVLACNIPWCRGYWYIICVLVVITFGSFTMLGFSTSVPCTQPALPYPVPSEGTPVPRPPRASTLGVPRDTTGDGSQPASGEREKALPGDSLSGKAKNREQVEIHPAPRVLVARTSPLNCRCVLIDTCCCTAVVLLLWWCCGGFCRWVGGGRSVGCGSLAPQDGGES